MLQNSETQYGAVTKTFHWIVALGILTNIPLGILANQSPIGSDTDLDRKLLLFSLHKTLGILIFAVAVLRILWAITQKKPRPLKTHKPSERFLAELVHWLLYASLVLVPLSGWVLHAASDGFAPLLLPFGDHLHFVPKSPELAHLAAALHVTFERVLVMAVCLHILGALKHHFIDRDATLRRMIGSPTAEVLHRHRRSFAPLLSALAVYVFALCIASSLGLFKHEQVQAQEALVAPPSQWAVQDGEIAITVVELGSETRGAFDDWTASINFSPEAIDGRHGDVDVAIQIASLKLGYVSDIAVGHEFFDAAQFPLARFSGPILSGDRGMYVDGNLTIRNTTLPVTLPFVLVFAEDTAEMQAQIILNRNDFGVGVTYTDPERVSFEVQVDIALTATMSPE